MRPICRLINANCVDDPQCPAVAQGISCWSVNGAACCRRNDKLRCLQCTIYLAHLEGSTDLTPMGTVPNYEPCPDGRHQDPAGTGDDEPVEDTVTIEPVEWPR